MTTATKTAPPNFDAPMKPVNRVQALLAALIFAAAIGGIWYYRERGTQRKSGANEVSSEQAESSPGQSAIQPIPVETVRMSKGGIVRTSAQIGTVHPFEEADLFAKISGYLENLHVDYGDHVKRDQLLAEIDDPEIVEDANKAAADVLQARAAVAQAEAFIESAKADRDASSTTVDQSIAEVDRFRSMRSYHEKKFARYRELVQSKAIPQQIADEEEESYESARASEVSSQKAVLNARAQLVAANARIKKAEADLSEAKANVEVAQAKLARAKVLVGYTKITSPYDGVVTKRNFFRGAFIRSASEGGLIPLLTIVRTDKVRVVTHVPDRDVPLTSVGDAAEVTLDALGDEVFKGKVSRFAESEDHTSRTMYTEIDLENPRDTIREGMYGIAKIILDTPMKSSTLPASCLVGESNDGDGSVFVIRDGKAKKIPIAVGTDDGLRVEVLSGLLPDDRVIVNTGSVTDGVPVHQVETRTSESTRAPVETKVPGDQARPIADGKAGSGHHE